MVLKTSDVEVYSGNQFVKPTPAVFLGKAEAHFETGTEFIQGTRLCFTRQSSRDALIGALSQVTEFCPNLTLYSNSRTCRSADDALSHAKQC